MGDAHVALVAQKLQERVKPLEVLPGRHHVFLFHREVEELDALRRAERAHAAEPAVGARREVLDRHGIPAAEHGHDAAGEFPDFGDPGEVRRAFLAIADVVEVLGQLGQGIGQDVGARRPRVVVDADRDADGLGDGGVMGIDLVRRQRPVGDGHDDDTIGAGAFGVLRQTHRRRRRHGAGSGDHRDAAACVLDRHLDDLAALVLAQRADRASAADERHAMHALADLVIEVAAQAIEIDGFAVVGGRGRVEREKSPEFLGCHRFSPL